MLNCLSDICCGEETQACFTEACETLIKVDSSIAAVALIENDSPPSIGDSVTLSTSLTPVVLTECNYADSLLQWVRDQQYSCPTGGQKYHFFKSGVLAKGTRAKATDRMSDNGSNYTAPERLGYETSALLKLEHLYMPNIDFIEGIKDRASSLSVIYFFKQGVLVLDENKGYQAYISNSGFEVTGTKGDFVMGEVDLIEKGDRQPSFYYAVNASAFIKELKKSTEFTFAAPTVTGIVAQACGSRGGCLAYTLATSTPWTFTPDVNELVACGSYTLYKDCDTTVIPAGTSVNASTGVITSTGLTAGEHKFTLVVRNECCIKGATCIIITVTAPPSPV